VHVLNSRTVVGKMRASSNRTLRTNWT